MTCDRHPSALAAWVVYTRSGLLYLCAHCHHKHAHHIARKGYRAVGMDAHKLSAGQTLGW